MVSTRCLRGLVGPACAASASLGPRLYAAIEAALATPSREILADVQAGVPPNNTNLKGWRILSVRTGDPATHAARVQSKAGEKFRRNHMGARQRRDTEYVEK